MSLTEMIVAENFVTHIESCTLNTKSREQRISEIFAQSNLLGINRFLQLRTIDHAGNHR